MTDAPKTDTKQGPYASAEMAALASDIADMWQDHLASIAADPTAKADFMRLIEPQRQAFNQMFADYNMMMHHAPHAARQTSHASGPAAPETTRSAPAATASDDSALRLAQLAHRVAALEERIRKLESRDESKTRKRAGKAAEKSE
jgi:ubiquinone biosynthesis protein UbiJ